MRVGECEARESSVCEGFQWKLEEGSSFVHGEQERGSRGDGGVEEGSEGYATDEEEEECTSEEIQTLHLDLIQHWKQ